MNELPELSIEDLQRPLHESLAFGMEAHVYYKKGKSIILNKLGTQNYKFDIFKLLFINSVGSADGAYFYDKEETSVSITDWFKTIIKEIKDEHKKDKDYQTKIYALNIEFPIVHKLLIKKGWKEKTEFSEEKVKEFIGIVSKYDITKKVKK